MALDEQKIKKHRELQTEKIVKSGDLNRLRAFLARKANNQDMTNAMKGNDILVKVAGTAFYMPYDIFREKIEERIVELESRLPAIDSELDAL